MKQRTSLINRCIALALALMLLVSQANLGIVQHARAAEFDANTTIAQIIADNYDLSEAEKNLLKSGYLVSDSYGYDIPSDEDALVSVDTENAKITASSKNGWVPTKAIIVYGGNELEVALTDGVGTYDAAVVGNAFSVKVVYQLSKNVETSVQEALLGAAALLKQGVKNLADVAGQEGNLSVLEVAMPELVDLAENGYVVGGNATPMGADFIEGVKALNAQMTANGGKLNLSVMIGEYLAGTKTGYLMTNGSKMQAEVVDTAAEVAAIAKDIIALADNLKVLESYGIVTPELAAKIRVLANSVSALNDGLAALKDASWPIAKLAAILAAEVDYAKLDTLVAALGEITAVNVKETLKVAETTIQVNMAMWNVTYKAVLKHMVNNELVEGFSAEKVVTLADGTSAEAVLAELKELVEKLEASESFVEGKFEKNLTEVPAELNADLTVEIVYTPKNFIVTIAGVSAEYPYGYEVTLPKHADSAKSYDYADADGKYYAQGTVVFVDKDMTFTREEGKAYTNGQLFAIIAGNYAAENEKVVSILSSGAVKGDEVISYREPSKGELENLVKLDGSTLTVQTYASSYAGLNWAPYSYKVNGNVHLFNGASSVVIAEDFETVDVYYRLTMTNYTEAEVRAIFDLVKTLNEEAKSQKSVMDNLAAYQSQMSQLNRGLLNNLSLIIGSYAKSEGGAFDDALVDSVKVTINDIMANSCLPDGSLKLNGIINEYVDPNNGGLIYYYQNSEYITHEVSYLSEKLAALLDDEQSLDLLATLLNDMSFAEYIDKLTGLNDKMAEIKASLVPVNAAIDTTDAAKLSALTKALSEEGSLEIAECGSPYIEMGPVIRTADKYVTVEVKVNAGGKTNTDAISVSILKGEALTQAQVNELKAKVNTFVGNTIETPYYSNNFSGGAELDALVGKALTASATYEYTWTAKEYTVKIEGEADQTVSINDLTIDLPYHPNATNGLSYEYTIGSNTAKSGIYTFDKTDLLNLFKNGVLTITRVEKNANVEKLVAMVNTINSTMGFEALELIQKDGKYTGIEANIAASDLMNLMMGLMKSGYNYVGLNNEAFIDSGELSIQTLINAVLNDETFTNETVIALGENGKGKLVSTTMQLGDSASELHYTNLALTLNLKSVPQALTNYVGYIKAISNYITFHSNNGVMAVEVNLPDQVYAAYAAALVATGNVDKHDVNELGKKVPVQFLYDYLTAITGSEMDLETFTNTLEMLGINRDLTAYNKYYTKAMAAYNQCVEVNVGEELTSIGLTAPGKKTINALLSLLGDAEQFSAFLPVLKEYDDEAVITFNATGELLNPDKTYYALVIDAQADGLRNKVEAPTSVAALAKELSELAGYSVVMLTANVEGDLTVAGTTILDLNGFNVTGTIHATGKLYIIDSSMGTNVAGTVGNVTGNASILAGCYESDVTSKLVAGCYLDNGMVRNAMYHIVEDENGNLTIVLDGDFFENMSAAGYLPDAKAIAVNMVTDLVLNYGNTAKVALGGYELVAADIDDLVGLYAGDNRVAKLVKTLIGCVTIGEEGYENNAGFEGVVNMILADMLDFEAITNALKNNTALATYAMTTAPWTIEIDHNTEKDYATVDLRYNAKLEKTINISLVVESKYNDNVAAMTEILAEIVVKDETFAMVDIPTPTYSDKTLTVSGAGKASLVMDMSNDNKYAIALGVILAYGNPAKAGDVAAAVNNNDMAALKVVVDNTSVKEIFTALKKLNRTTDFAAMAAEVGVTVDTKTAADVEAAFHLVFCAAGKVLEELDITGMDSKLGALYNAETGYYELSKTDIFRDKEFNVRSYAALVELEATELTLKVKLFSDCLWGDVNHDGLVNTVDASLIEEYVVKDGELDVFFCTKRADVNGDGEINTVDASLICEYAVGGRDSFPAENK